MRIMSHNNFVRILLTTLVASAVVIGHTENTLQLLLVILGIALVVESLCVFRLVSLGYSTREAIFKLFLKGEKLDVFLNKVPKK